MNYYNEQGVLLTEAPDLTLGWLEEREINHISAVPAVTHKEYKTLPGGRKLSYTVVDTPEKPARKEVVSYTYKRYEDYPTIEMRLGAVEGAVQDIAMEVYGNV